MKLIYDVKDKPKFNQVIVFAIQQLLAIMAATLLVPIVVGHGMSPSAALFGAGVGSLIYILFTKGKSPVFLGSSFAFIPSMTAAFAGSVSMTLGYLGLIIGAAFACIVYVIIAIAVKFAGVNWINKLMPTVVIGPTVSVIGLSLAGSAVTNMQSGNVVDVAGKSVASPLICLLCGLIALFATIIASCFGKKTARLIPFIIGIFAGYISAAIFTIIGNATGSDAMKIIDFAIFKTLLTDGKVTLGTFFTVPDFTFLTAFKGFKELNLAYVLAIAVAYVPVAFVVFAEHIADHKNISSIIEKDLLEDPGLHRTLLGDGVGSLCGAFFGGCPNTTYGESVACVAITKNASVITIFASAVGAILISFLNPLIVFVNSIPPCVMGGICVALYGFIAVSGLKMLKDISLDDNRNLFVVSSILVTGIGGLSVSIAFKSNVIVITSVAVSLIIGILVNLIVTKHKNKEQ